MSQILRRAMDVDSAGIWLMADGAILGMALTPDIAESIGPYLDYYRQIDPWAFAGGQPLNQVSFGSDKISEPDLVRTEFYNDFARRFGMLRPMGIVMDLEPGLLVNVSLNRTSPEYLLQPEDKPVLQAFAGHLKRALQTWMRFQAGPAGWHAAAFDLLAFAVVICDAFGRVIYANAAAREHDAQRRGLTLRGAPTRIGALVPSEAAMLSRAVFEATSGRLLAGRSLRLTGLDGRMLSVQVTPLPPTVADGFGSGKALLAIGSEDAVPSADAAVLRRLYGLSPAQAELCRALAAGRTFEEIAAERAVAVSTLRTHLATVLARTGARNLRDLIRLLGGLPQIASQDGD